MRKLAAFRKLSSPFVGDKPLDSISLCFYGDSTGIKEWNRSSDPMPIKTMNMAGLQKWEETDDYIIYIDKDAVMTTVAKYAPGSYQTFMERKADVDNSRSLLKVYSIEWTQQDDSNLFIQCNDEAIYKIENQPMTLDEPTQPVVLEPKTVPTTYECCFRVDKKTGEIYIGEGYENLAVPMAYVFGGTPVLIGDCSYRVVVKGVGSTKNVYNAFERVYNKVFVTFYSNSKCDLAGTNVSADGTIEIVGNKCTVYGDWDSSKINGIFVNIKKADGSLYQVGEYFEFSNPQITKTNTVKPFVKSVMPSGKLDRITNANETTHAFLNKGDGVVTFGNGYFSLKGEKIQQLLVYNALLTEQEKQTELAKDIKLR